MYKRILLKLSGESLMGSQSHGIDPQRLQEYAQQIKAVHEMGVLSNFENSVHFEPNY